MGEQTKTPLWLDCDPGHDDACAILLAAYHPSLELIGVSTVHGNAPLSRTTVNALSVLEAIGKPQIHVCPGSSKPFCRPGKTAPDIHGASGLAGTNLLPEPARSALTHCNAILEMKEALFSQPGGTAWLVATGPLTNIALLFATFPSLADHIAGLAIMGGAIGSDFTHVSIVKPALFEKGFSSTEPPLTSSTPSKMGQPYLDTAGTSHARSGNSTPFAEFNIWADPESARSVLQSQTLAPKTTLIPLDVTHQAYATPKIQEMLLNGGRGPTRLRRMFNELLMFFARTYAEVFGLPDGPPLHDPLAVAAILSNHADEDVKIPFDDNGGERWVIDVILQGEQIGRTVITKSESGQGVRIPRTLDLDKFWRTLNECMASADEMTRYGK
ncbi:Uridine nucleosidase 1 [Cladophialophora chaetospira]|uniref:Uridine nucleosidase 1 n=1 Tax=Cladophialophora chaetospira TaxID=386627 RepID=A0AA38X7R4_9EURO|nr:Uridine nucleosidase 1 [Cladophialophora chaetospira]